MSEVGRTTPLGGFVSTEQAEKAVLGLLKEAGHVCDPHVRCPVRVVRGEPIPGPSCGPPQYCILDVGHEGPHRSQHGGPLRGETEEVVLPQRCLKCRQPWPCSTALSVLAAPAGDTTAGYGAEGVVDKNPAPQEGVEAARVGSPLERERFLSIVGERLDAAFWAGSEMSQTFDSAKETDAILAALRPSPDSGGSGFHSGLTPSIPGGEAST
jgi:hypothetical protein